MLTKFWAYKTNYIERIMESIIISKAVFLSIHTYIYAE